MRTVGSGLILLVIVGAWLAVLVPMGLRSHDSATSLRSTDRFSDAMRVLSRRPTGHERTALMPRRAPNEPVLSTGPETPRRRSVVDRLADLDARAAADRPSVPLVVRRRRTLLALVAVGLLLLVAGAVGPGLLLVPGLLLLALAVAFSVHCRRQAVLRQRRLRAQRRHDRAAARRGAAPRVAGIPSRMPARPAPLAVPLPAPAVRHDEPVPAALVAPAATSDGTWQPVPVPLPTYVGKDRAPARPPRVLDLTRPGQWSAALEAEDGVLAELGDGRELDAILDRRRAVGGW